LRRRVIGTLFIKLELILHEWSQVVVNGTLVSAIHAVNAELSGQTLLCRRGATAKIARKIPELVGHDMAEPRKIFRIEEYAAARRAPGADQPPEPFHHTEIMEALVALRSAMAAVPPSSAAKAETAAQAQRQWLGVEAEQITRIAHELAAVTAGTDEATQKILGAAEEIDQLANNLSAALKGRIEQGLAQDIAELVIRIFEACNFQDLISQRVTKVMTLLKFIEDHVGRALDEIKNAPSGPAADDPAQYLHGPRLDTDSGHISQAEIDAMFGG
jgi:chemotaxis protein CheZ